MVILAHGWWFGDVDVWGRVPVVAPSPGGSGVSCTLCLEMLLFLRLALFPWRGPLETGEGAVEADVADASYGDWPCSIRCTFGGVSRSNLGHHL